MNKSVEDIKGKKLLIFGIADNKNRDKVQKLGQNGEIIIVN
jgi:hypothetical protein